jgi:hypothetical protein
MTQPIISIEVYAIEDFIREAQERDIKRVYRGSSSSNRPYRSTVNTYTAYDPIHRVFVKGGIVFPEIIELERMDAGKNYSAWDFGPTATCTPTSKRKFVNILKQLGVDKEEIKSFSSVKVEELHRLIDSSELEEGGADEHTIYKRGGELIREMKCDFMRVIHDIKVVIKKDYNSLTYRIDIEYWDKLFESLCEVHETALVMNGLEVVGGAIEVR